MPAPVSKDVIIRSAIDAKSLAIAPYSNYKVGAALLTDSGELFTAGNIESSTYGLTLCAERVATFAALAAGHRKFQTIAVATDNGATPCGACRQILWEFAGNIQVILIDGHSESREISLTELFPHPFDDSSLHSKL